MYYLLPSFKGFSDLLKDGRRVLGTHLLVPSFMKGGNTMKVKVVLRGSNARGHAIRGHVVGHAVRGHAVRGHNG